MNEAQWGSMADDVRYIRNNSTVALEQIATLNIRLHACADLLAKILDALTPDPVDPTALTEKLKSSGDALQKSVDANQPKET